MVLFRGWWRIVAVTVVVVTGSTTEGADMTQIKKAAFAAGCFWGVEKILAKVDGVTATAVGYMGGTTPNPTYREVCTGRTGHAETVEVTYDPSKVSYEQLVITFFEYHDPTTRDRQGPDVGSQYRSVIFTYDDEQAAEAHRAIERLRQAKVFRQPIATEIVPAASTTFYRAEEYHQQYLQKNPDGYCSHHFQSAKIRAALQGQLHPAR